MRKILFMAIVLLSVSNAVGQDIIDLTTLSQPVRDSLLLARAKEFVLACGDDRYYDTADPNPIIKYTAPNNIDKKYYSVTYLYDPYKVLFDREYLVKVIFDATTGRVLQVAFGRGFNVGVLWNDDYLEIDVLLNSSLNVSYSPWWKAGDPESDFVTQKRLEIRNKQSLLRLTSGRGGNPKQF